jgi:hypothetical protein
MNTVGLAINSHNPDAFYIRDCLMTGSEFDHIYLYAQNVGHEANDIIEDIRDLGRNLTYQRSHINIGVVDGFNHAIQSVATDWICPFCDDDFFITPHLRTVLGMLRHGVLDCYDVVHYQVQTDAMTNWGSPMDFERLKQENHIPHGSMVKSPVMHAIGGYKSEVSSDWELWLRLAKAGYRFHYIDLPVYHFRSNPNGQMARELKLGFPAIREMVLKSAGITA